MHKNLLLALVCFYTLAIGVLSLISLSEYKTVKVVGADKIVHMGFHFIFSIMWYWYFLKSNFLSTRRQMKIRVVTMSLFYGILIEALQHLLTDTRQADVWDLAANIVGSVLAIAVLTALEKILSSRKI